MPTPHISAERGDFAKTVLMPGDPLRAKFFAEQFLDDLRLVNEVRGMLGYTGTYKGKPVSVMAHGMGIPSIGIYSYELFKFYDVDNIIRIGSTGGYTADLKLYDTVLATAAYSESTYALYQNGDTSDIMYPSEELNEKLRDRSGRFAYLVGLFVICISELVFSILGKTGVITDHKIIVWYLFGLFVFQIVIGNVVYRLLRRKY